MKNDLIGDVVLIKEENTPRMKWKMGKVLDVVKGRDGLIRGVQIEVFQPHSERCTILNRPLQLIVPLEVNKRNEVPLESKQVVDDVFIRSKRVAALDADAKRKANVF